MRRRRSDKKKKKGTSSKDGNPPQSQPQVLPEVSHPTATTTRASGKSPSQGPSSSCGENPAGEEGWLRARGIEGNAPACPLTYLNQSGQRKEFAKSLYLDESGLGVATRAPIPKGNLVVPYVGVLTLGVPYPNQDYAYPLTDYYEGKGNKGEDIYIYSEEKGNLSRFIQHAEEPNCEVHRWWEDREVQLLVVAGQDIPAGEVLTLRYPQKSRLARIQSAIRHLRGPLEPEIARTELQWELRHLLRILLPPAAFESEPYFFEKWILDNLGFSYSKTNVYTPRQKAMLSEKTGAREPFPEDDGPIFQVVQAAIFEKHFSKRGKSPEQKLSCSCEGNPAAEVEMCAGEDCSLRASRVECSRICSPLCQNQRIQRGEFPKCLHLKTGSSDREILLVTSANIPKGHLVVEYVGEMTSGLPYITQSKAYRLRDYNGGREIYINSEKIGNESRFIQHSEEPNCEVQEWVVEGKVRLLVIAKEHIRAGEVLTLRYPHRSAQSGATVAVINVPRSKQKADKGPDYETIYLELLGIYYSNTNVYTPSRKEKGSGKKEDANSPAAKQFPEDGCPIFRTIRAAILNKHSKSPGLSCGCEGNPAGDGCAGGDCSLQANRVECSLLNCSSPCRNQRIQREEFPESLYVICAPLHREFAGLCVIARASIPKGNLVVEYVGEMTSGVLHHNQPYAYPLRDYSGGKDIYINSEKIGNGSRCITHSEEPNCEMQEWVVDMKVRLLVVALEDIAKDEVITLRYPQKSSSSGEQYARLTEAEITKAELELERLSLHSPGPSKESSGDKPKAKGTRGRTKRKGHDPDASHVCRYGHCKKGFPTSHELEEHQEECHHAVLSDKNPDRLSPERVTETLMYFPGMEHLEGVTLENTSNAVIMPEVREILPPHTKDLIMSRVVELVRKIMEKVTGTLDSEQLVHLPEFEDHICENLYLKRLQQVKAYFSKAELREIIRQRIQAVMGSRTVEEVSEVVPEEISETPGLEDMDCETLAERGQNPVADVSNNSADERVVTRQHAQALMRTRTVEDVSANIRRQLGQDDSDSPLDSD